MYESLFLAGQVVGFLSNILGYISIFLISFYFGENTEKGISWLIFNMYSIMCKQMFLLCFLMLT